MFRDLIKKSDLSANLKNSILFIMVSSPLTLCQWSYDTGRFDHINFFNSYYFVFSSFEQEVFIVGLLLSIGVLIHEAIVFYGVPIVLFLEFLNFKNFNLKYLFVLTKLFLPMIISSLAILFIGNIENLEALEKLYQFDGVGENAWERKLFQLSLNQPLAHYSISLIYLTLIFSFFTRIIFLLGGLSGLVLIFILPSFYSLWEMIILDG